MICMTLDCVRPTQFSVIQISVIQIIYRHVGLKCFLFLFTKLFVCCYHYTLIFHLYFTR